jgi:hypothetical protein
MFHAMWLGEVTIGHRHLLGEGRPHPKRPRQCSQHPYVSRERLCVELWPMVPGQRLEFSRKPAAPRANAGIGTALIYRGKSARKFGSGDGFACYFNLMLRREWSLTMIVS